MGLCKHSQMWVLCGALQGTTVRKRKAKTGAEKVAAEEATWEEASAGASAGQVCY